MINDLNENPGASAKSNEIPWFAKLLINAVLILVILAMAQIVVWVQKGAAYQLASPAEKARLDPKAYEKEATVAVVARSECLDRCALEHVHSLANRYTCQDICEAQFRKVVAPKGDN